MQPVKKPRRVSRLKWVSLTLNAVFICMGLAIANDYMVVSMSPIQIASVPQAQVMPASLPVNPYLAGR